VRCSSSTERWSAGSPPLMYREAYSESVARMMSWSRCASDDARSA
jgi:hypothetical protein